MIYRHLTIPALTAIFFITAPAAAATAAEATTAAAGATAAAEPEVLRTQSIEEVLAAIEANNPDLAALRNDVEAQALLMKSENMPEDPTIEYSSFYSPGNTGQAGSELVVSQGFDFPTLYAARHKRNAAAQASLNSSLAAERREILLEAKSLCLDIIVYRQIADLLSSQAAVSDSLLTLFSRRLDSGDASSLEVNKIRMELMSVATEVAQNNAALDAACRALQAMNGGQPISFEADWFPLFEEIYDYEAVIEEYLSSDATVSAAESAVEAAQKEVSLNRQGWIPKLEIGYRRNTALREAEHGFLVGGSIPLFSNHRKVAAAKAQSVAAGSTLTSAKLSAETQARTLLSSIAQTKSALEAYDEPLMRETLSLLNKAVEGGELSLIDYFVEASAIYHNLENCITLRGELLRLTAQLYKNRL